MSNRMRSTILLTAIAGPVGSVLLAVLLGRWADSTQAGMAGLAAVVAGLMFGGGILAFVVFGVCLWLLLVRGEVDRPWRAVGVMMVAAAANVGATVLALALAARSGTDATIPAVVGAIVSIAVLAGGAYVALRVGRAAPMMRE